MSGMKRPRVVILDELTTGLDPTARRRMWGTVERLRSEGVSVLLVSHSMEEVERLCDEGASVACDHLAPLVELADTVGWTLPTTDPDQLQAGFTRGAETGDLLVVRDQASFSGSRTGRIDNQRIGADADGLQRLLETFSGGVTSNDAA